jgi:hypothetical protein
MTLEVVDRHQRLAGRPRDRLGGHQPDDQPADQARPGGRGNRIDLVERHIGAGERFLDQPVQRLDMRARRDLRHDAAIGAVFVELRQHDVGEDFAAAVLMARDDGSRRLVAASFNAEDAKKGRHTPIDNCDAG